MIGTRTIPPRRKKLEAILHSLGRAEKRQRLGWEAKAEADQKITRTIKDFEWRTRRSSKQTNLPLREWICEMVSCSTSKSRLGKAVASWAVSLMATSLSIPKQLRLSRGTLKVIWMQLLARWWGLSSNNRAACTNMRNPMPTLKTAKCSDFKFQGPYSRRPICSVFNNP